MEKGIVKWFNEEKGYGFIQSPSHGDIFFHCSSLNDDEAPGKGDTVSFDIANGKQGKLKAVNVSVVERIPRVAGKPYYGKPRYVEKKHTKIGLPAILGTMVVGGEAGAIIGELVGKVFGYGSETHTTRTEITSECIKCGGIGQVTNEVNGFRGFQCKSCGNFWKERI